VSPTVTRERVEGALLAGAGLALAALAPVTWREGVAALVLAAGALVLKEAASGLALGFGYGLLSVGAVAHGSLAARLVALVIAGVLLVWLAIRRGSWPHHLLPATLLGGLLAVGLPLGSSWLADAPLSRTEVLPRWPLVVAAFTVTLLGFARQPAPVKVRWVSGGLVLAALLGLAKWGMALAAVWTAESALTAVAWDEAGRASMRAGWAQGERRARLGQARAWLAAKDASRALEVLPPALTKDRAGWLVRAEALRLLGRGAEAMEEVHRALQLRGAAGDMPAETAVRVGLWEARRGKPFPVEAVADDVQEPERYLAEAASRLFARGEVEEARRVLARASANGPESPFVSCAAAEITEDLDRARACLTAVAGHRPSLELLAKQGDTQASETLARFDSVPRVQVAFDGVLRLMGTRVPQTVQRGSVLALEFAVEVQSNGAPGESYLPFLLLYGGGTAIDASPRIAAPSHWVRGSVEVLRVEVPLPETPARYVVHLGFRGAGEGRRLQPEGQPGHIQFVEFGPVEVLP